MAGMGILGRLGYREKRLVAALFGVVLVVLVLGTWLWLETATATLAEEYDEGVETLEQLRTEARTYLQSVEKKKALEEIVRKNDPRIQTAIDSIARKVDVRIIRTESEERSTFDKQVRYDAKTTKRQISFADGKDEGERKKKKNDKVGGIVELTQPMEFGFVEFGGLLEFLNSVEAPGRLMYVSSLEVSLKFGSEDFVRGKTAVSTFIYEGAPEELEEESK
jgi:hypothetical protein